MNAITQTIPIVNFTSTSSQSGGFLEPAGDATNRTPRLNLDYFNTNPNVNETSLENHTKHKSNPTYIGKWRC
jgi:hypothetical protein